MQATMDKMVTSVLPGGNPHQKCIDSLMKCAQICQECLNLCLQESDVGSRMNCIKNLQDCAEICSATVCFMSRGSGHIREIANACVTICDECANACDMFMDRHCQECATVCKQCADECKSMMGI